MLMSSPKQKESEAFEAYRLLFQSAKRSIKIITAYLIPDTQIILMLEDAIKRGVEIEIVMPGRHNDSKIAQIRSRSRWEQLLKMGVKLYRYEKTMIHAKALMIDDRWVSIGSINFDLLSLRLNEEANLIVDSPQFAEQMQVIFQKDKAIAKELNLEDHRQRSGWEKVAEFFVRRIPAPWWVDDANY